MVLLRCLFVATVDLFKSYGLKRISLLAELAGDFGTAGRGEGPAAKMCLIHLDTFANTK